MEELKKWFVENLPDKNLGWLILHKIEDSGIPLGDWEIVMTDNEVSDRNLPFTYSPGYFSLKETGSRDFWPFVFHMNLINSYTVCNNFEITFRF